MEDCDTRGEGEAAPRRRDRDATSRALLSSASAIFAEQGYDAATTREIAARAGVNEALIQRYFGGKAGLLAAIFSQQHGDCPYQGGGQASGDLTQVIRSFFKRSCGETEQNQQFMKVVVSRAILDPTIGALMKERIFEADRARILGQLQARQRDGSIRGDAPLEPVADALAALAFSLGFMGRLVYQRPEAEIDAAIGATAELFAAGLRAPQPTELTPSR